MVLRNGLFTTPVPTLAAQQGYWSKNETDHCLCSNLGVTSLACDDITVNKFYQLILAWVLIGSDMALVFSSYVLILCSAIQLNSSEAMSKALGTCSSHLILILFSYIGIIALSAIHLAEKKIPLILYSLMCCTTLSPLHSIPWATHSGLGLGLGQFEAI